MIGKTIQGYRVDALLGEGGMGKVYLATDMALDRKVAIKNLNANLVYDATFLERFTNEARILSRLSHPNIALLYNYIQVDRDHYMVMEYLEGHNLDAYVHTYGALPPVQLVPILNALLDGLGYAHEKGVLHRDIKPANLMLMPNGSVKIMDFGIARISDQANRLTKVKSVIGTLDYLAPELIQGVEPSRGSDCYALGVVAYELATGGILPFKGTSEFALMKAITNGKPLPPDRLNKKVPGKLASIILKAMDANPAARFADTCQFRAALTKAFPNYRTFYVSATKPTPAPTATTESMDPSITLANTRLMELEHERIPLATQLMDQVAIAPRRPTTSTRYPYGVYAVGMTAALLVILAFALLLWPHDGPSRSKQNNEVLDRTYDNQPTNQRLVPVGNEESGTAQKAPTETQQLLTTTTDVSPLVVQPDPGSSSDPMPGASTQSTKKSEDVSKPDRVMEQFSDKAPEMTVVPTPERKPEEESEGEPEVRPERMPNSIVLEESLKVNLHLEDNLHEGHLEKGQMLTFSVTAAVVYRGTTIIPKGAAATAEIDRVTSRQVSIRFKGVEGVGGRSIPFAKSEFSGKISDMLASTDFVVTLEKGIKLP